MKKLILKITKITAFLSFVLLFTIGIVKAQKTNSQINKQSNIQSTYKSMCWMDETLGIEIYLIENGSEKRDFNLLVVSDKQVKVIYRTTINSMKPVIKEITPIKTKNGRHYYNVLHSFSRTTIWMALDFMIEGEKVDSLTRTFYSSISEIVPNEQFQNQ